MSSEKNREICYCVVLLYSVSGALRAEKLLRERNISIKVIPVPRHLSSDCGVCVRFAQEDESVVREVLSGSNVEIQRIRPIE